MGIQTVFVLVGESGSGKSRLASAFKHIMGDTCKVVSTSAILKAAHPEIAPTDRDALLEAGKRLSSSTDLPWFFPEEMVQDAEVVVIDAMRVDSDIEWLRRKKMATVIHVGASPEGVPFRPYDVRLMKHTNPVDQALGVLETTISYTADAVIGAQWGSEGKGKVAAWLASTHGYSAMGRAGSPNAGHRVELPDGTYKVFRHLPSAAPYAKPGTKLCLGPGAVIDLDVLRSELPFVPAGVELVVDPHAVVVTEQARELERMYGCAQLGSTMTGSGGTTALRVLRYATTFERAQREMGETGDPLLKVSIRPVGLELRMAAVRGHVLLESTQGMQLSLYHGAYPHVTGRDVSPVALLTEMGLPADFPTNWWVVARAYPIRVAGPSGDLPLETTWNEVSQTSGRTVDSLNAAERTSVTNRLRRVAKWERGALLAAVRRNFFCPNLVRVVITFADYLKDAPEQMAEIVSEARLASGRGVVYEGFGPKCTDIRPSEF